MFSKKGQSALEYLMTYGWALVVIVIVIAALVILVGNPSSLSKGCQQTLAGFTVRDSIYDATSNDMNVALINQTGLNLDASDYTVSITGGTLSSTESDPWNSGINQLFSYTGVTPSNGQVTLTVTYAGPAGSKTATATCNI